MDNDWRLKGQDRYLMSGSLSWRSWTETRAGWDHDHCEFCGKKIWDRQSDSEADNAGYTDADQYRWVCSKCAEDFASRFDLTLVGGPAAT